jgi:hypothetical protein
MFERSTQKKRMFVRVLPLCGLVATGLFAGCGGGNSNGLLGNNGGNNGASVAENLAAGQTSLFAVTQDNDITEADRASLVSAAARFQAVVNAQSNNSQARASLALIQLALLGLDGFGQFGGNANVRSTSNNLTNIGNPESALRAALDIQNIPSLLKSVASSVVSPAARTRSATHGEIDDVQNYLSGATLTAINSAAANLTAAIADQNVSLQVFNRTGRNTLNRADLVILTGGLQAISGVLNVGGAYNIDPGNFYDNRSFSSPSTIDANGDGTLTPSEYIAPAPFGTLKSGGSQRLSTALTTMRTALTTSNTGITAKLAEADIANELIPVTADLRTALQRAQGQIPLAQTALNGPITVSDVTVNIPAFLNNPIADIRTAAPNLTIQNGRLVPGNLPNPTLNGLFPNGIPTSLFN